MLHTLQFTIVPNSGTSSSFHWPALFKYHTKKVEMEKTSLFLCRTCKQNTHTKRRKALLRNMCDTVHTYTCILLCPCGWGEKGWRSWRAVWVSVQTWWRSCPCMTYTRPDLVAGRPSWPTGSEHTAHGQHSTWATWNNVCESVLQLVFLPSLSVSLIPSPSLFPSLPLFNSPSLSLF